MTGKFKLTPGETVRLAKMRDDPELAKRIAAVALRLEGVPHLTLCNMFAGFIVGGAASYQEALQATERMIALTRDGLKEEQPS